MRSTPAAVAIRNNDDKNKQQPHAVCIPYPAQGHINPMTKLARLLHHRGFHITFVHTDYNYRRLLRSRGTTSLNSLPSFRFETIPDGLPPSDDADVTQDIPSLCTSMDKNSGAPFKKLLEKLLLAGSNSDDEGRVPLVTCIISDVTLPFTLDVAEEMGILDVQLWTASACGFLGYALYRPLIEKGLVPVQDNQSSLLDTVIDWAPKPLKGIRLRDLPTFIKSTDKKMLDFLLSMMERVPRSSAIILNTFESLEGQFISCISKYLPPLYPCGPFQLLLDQIQDDDETLSLIESNLWKDDNGSSIQNWLDSKPPTSVVYVNFGSITVMTADQLVEFAWGLANSGNTFLWIIRPDLVSGESSVLPQEFVEKTKQEERGMLASWCDQDRVLRHPAIGGFLTHNGWNSTIESLMNGVAMISWPFFAEQQTNFWYCKEIGVAMKIDTDVKREEVAKQVKELMDEEKGMEMRKRALEWKRLANEAVVGSFNGEINGESLFNFDRLINEILLSRKF